MFLRSLAAALALLSIAPAAAAQTAPPAAEQRATPQEIAAARAYADRLIAEAGAEGVFVNKTESGVAEVQHLASGMTCLFDQNPANRIVIFPSVGAGVPRGDDVGCITRDDGVDIDMTTYATRYPDRPSEQAVLQGAVNAIRNRWPDAVPFDGDVASVTTEGQTPARTASFKVEMDGIPKLTMAVVSHTGDWSYKVRVTGPYDQAMAVGLYGSMAMTYIRMKLAERD